MMNLVFSVVATLLACCQHSLGSYTERLTLKPIVNGYVHAHFDFTTQAPQDTLKLGHYNLFPRALAEILAKYRVREIDLSLTQGLWRYQRWGIPQSGSAAANGAEVIVMFENNVSNPDENWKGLVNALSGMICASLNFMDSKITVSPQYTIRPRGAVGHGNQLNQTLVRYSSIAAEVVCTENLTPWKKLLPCYGQAGLSSLLAAKPLLDANYHSMGLSVRQVCANAKCTETSLQHKQTLSVVFDASRSKSQPSGWSLRSLFGTGVKSTCAVADSSDVIIKYTKTGLTAMTFTPASAEEVEGEEWTEAFFPVNDGLDIQATLKSLYAYTTVTTPPSVYAHRYITGYGQEKGSIVCDITNTLDEVVQIINTENIPWFLRVYAHTLNVTNSVTGNIKPSKVNFVPGQERKRPYLIELLLNLPANSTTTISFEFERLLLRWTEYPPDANLGFFIPSSIITASLPDVHPSAALQMTKDGHGVVRIYTESLLVALPTPDFSMPYNVICLACTVVAIAFGSFHSVTSRTLDQAANAPPGFITRMKAKLLGNKATKTKDGGKSEEKSPETKEEKPVEKSKGE